jgi:hypothetical protein
LWTDQRSPQLVDRCDLPERPTTNSKTVWDQKPNKISPYPML